jgi:hypothetical protein
MGHVPMKLEPHAWGATQKSRVAGTVFLEVGGYEAGMARLSCADANGETALPT